MKLTSSFMFLLVLIASGSCQETTSTVNPTDSTTLSTQTDTTVTTETTVPSTTQPDTTTVVTSTTTNPTTSTLPSTTVETSTNPQTTSPVPDTSTPTVPTTKSPEPPTPVEGSWNVTEGNLTCIRADLKIRFTITMKDHVEYIVLSPNATSNGNCELSNTTQELQLEESNYNLIMLFEKDSDNAYLHNITFSYMLPDGRGTVYNDTKLFSAKLGNSYMCDSSNNVILGNVTMEIFRIHIQSFGNVGNKDFGTAEECEADNKVNDMVPIAVGIALLCLVVVVLVAYFVGRRRSRQKGYQSV